MPDLSRLLQQVIIVPLNFTIRSLNSSSLTQTFLKIASLESSLFDYRTMKISRCIFWNYIVKTLRTLAVIVS